MEYERMSITAKLRRMNLSIKLGQFQLLSEVQQNIVIALLNVGYEFDEAIAIAKSAPKG